MRVAVLTLLLALWVAGPVSGSELWTIEVMQPFDLPNGIAVSRVTYVEYGSSWPEVVTLTCARNAIIDGSKTVNGNAAAKLGLRSSSRAER